MVTKRELKKNKIDIQYKFESQKAILALTLGTITMLGIVTILWINQQKALAIFLGAIIFLFAMILYSLSRKEMTKLLKKIDKI